MATLEDLTAAKTAAEFETEILADLADTSVTGTTQPFPVTSWQSGGVARTLIAVWAVLSRSFNDLIRAVTQGVLLELSSGAWLTLLAYNVYQVTRDAAVSTVGLVELTDASGSPTTFAAGELTVTDSSGRRFQNDLAATLPANGSHFFRVVAMNDDATLTPSGYNVSNSTITTLVTAVAGVTCNNPVPWITVFGRTGVATRGYIVLTSATGGAIGVGGCGVDDGAGHGFLNVDAVTLVAGVPQSVLFEAAFALATYNVGTGELTNVAVDPIGDIVAVNSAPASGTWITTSGADEQSDASLRTECKEKWSTLGVGWTSDAIKYLAKQAVTSTPVTDAKVETNPGGVSGLVGVTVRSAAGAMSGGDVAIVQAYLDAHRTLTSDITVSSATTLTIAISGVVYVPAAYLGTAQATATTNLIALEASVPVGGDDDAANAVQLEDILAAIKAPAYDATGVNTNPASPLRIQLTAPTGDTALTAYQVPDFDYSGLTYVGV